MKLIPRLNKLKDWCASSSFRFNFSFSDMSLSITSILHQIFSVQIELSQTIVVPKNFENFEINVKSWPGLDQLFCQFHPDTFSFRNNDLLGAPIFHRFVSFD